jgi:hypothetical protein
MVSRCNCHDVLKCQETPIKRRFPKGISVTLSDCEFKMRQLYEHRNIWISCNENVAVKSQCPHSLFSLISVCIFCCFSLYFQFYINFYLTKFSAEFNYFRARFNGHQMPLRARLLAKQVSLLVTLGYTVDVLPTPKIFHPTHYAFTYIPLLDSGISLYTELKSSMYMVRQRNGRL